MSSEAIKNRSANIVAIEPSGAVRQLLTDVLRNKEFKNVQAVANVKEAIHILEVESVDWILTPLLSDQDPNAIQLLKLIVENYDLKSTRVSFFVSSEENGVLPLAFENGLLSFFSKPFNKDSIVSELNQLMSVFEENAWDDKRVAANYLKRHLLEGKDYVSQIALAKSFLDIFPGDYGYLSDLVRPLFMTGQKEQAKSTIMQLFLLDSSKEAELTALYEEFYPGDSLKNKIASGVAINALGIKDAVVVDSDSASKKAIIDALQGIGVENVQAFDDGQAAWDHMEANPESGLIIQEWRIPSLTGPLMVQRIREKFPCVPIIVASSLLTEPDFPLVKEMGVASVSSKPIDRNKFLKTIIQTIQQERSPSDVEALERKIRQNLSAGKKEEAAKLREKYQASSIPSSRKAKIEAEFAYAQGDYELARDLAIMAIRNQKDSILLLNLLGKVFMKLQDFQAALRCFEKAQTMSPMNIQRLCAIAEVNSELGNDAAAQEAIDRAKSVDAGASSIFEVQTKIALSDGDVQKANKMMSQLDTIMNIISYSNNKAIAYARGGKIDEGITLYKKTIESIPEAKKSLTCLVEYNLALAYARGDMLEEAQNLLDKIIAAGESKVFKKAESLHRRIETAIKKGSKLELLSSDAAMKLETNDQAVSSEGSSEEKSNLAKQPKKEHAGIVAQVQLSAGDLCCFQIFNYPAKHDPKYLKMFAKTPHFTKRETIERQATGGVDRDMKASM